MVEAVEMGIIDEDASGKKEFDHGTTIVGLEKEVNEVIANDVSSNLAVIGGGHYAKPSK